MKSIQLSDDLLARITGVIEEHEPAAQDNASVTAQYLAALIGYMCSEFPGSSNEKEDYLDQLHALARHVLDERTQPPVEAAPATPAGRIEANPDNPATGIWRAQKGGM